MKESVFSFLDCAYIQPCVPPWLLETFDEDKIWERISPFLSDKKFLKCSKKELRNVKYANGVLVFCNTSDSGTFQIYRDDESLEIEPRYGDVLAVESGKTKIDFSKITGDVPVLFFRQKEEEKFDFHYCRDEFNLDRLRDDISSTRTTRNPYIPRSMRNMRRDMRDKKWLSQERESIYEDYFRRKKNEERFRINYSEEA